MSTELEVPQTMHMDPDHNADPAPHKEGERQLTARERMMADIARHAQEHREQEEALGAEYDREARDRGEALPPSTFEREPEPVVEAAQEHEAPAVEPIEPPQVAASAAQPAPAHPQVRQIVINGQQLALTDEQIMNLAQFGAQAVQGMYQQPAPVAAPEPVAPPAPSVAIDEARVREAVQRIQFGSPDEGTQALAGLIQDVVRQVPQAPHIDQQRLISEAEQRAVQRIAAEHINATIQSEYPEIFKDKALIAAAQVRENEIRQHALATGRRVNDLDIYREAGNQVYDLLKLPRPGSEITQPTAPQAAPAIQPTRSATIEERKRAAPRNPQPVDRRSAVPEAPRPPSGSEIVNAMRVQRGQQSLQ